MEPFEGQKYVDSDDYIIYMCYNDVDQVQVNVPINPEAFDFILNLTEEMLTKCVHRPSIWDIFNTSLSKVPISHWDSDKTVWQKVDYGGALQGRNVTQGDSSQTEVIFISMICRKITLTKTQINNTQLT